MGQCFEMTLELRGRVAKSGPATAGSHYQARGCGDGEREESEHDWIHPARAGLMDAEAWGWAAGIAIGVAAGIAEHVEDCCASERGAE